MNKKDFLHSSITTINRALNDIYFFLHFSARGTLFYSQYTWTRRRYDCFFLNSKQIVPRNTSSEAHAYDSQKRGKTKNWGFVKIDDGFIDYAIENNAYNNFLISERQFFVRVHIVRKTVFSWIYFLATTMLEKSVSEKCYRKHTMHDVLTRTYIFEYFQPFETFSSTS